MTSAIFEYVTHLVEAERHLKNNCGTTQHPQQHLATGDMWLVLIAGQVLSSHLRLWPYRVHMQDTHEMNTPRCGPFPREVLVRRLDVLSQVLARLEPGRQPRRDHGS